MRRPKLPKPVCLTEGRVTDKYPRILVDRRNRLWLAWQRFSEGRDAVVVTCLRDNMVAYQQAFSDFGCAYRPVLCEDAAGRIVVAWSEVSQAGADVFLSVISRGRRALPVKVSTGGKDLDPALAPDPDGGIWVAYHSFRRGSAGVYLRRFVSDWSDEIEVAPGMEAYRPAVVALGGGKVRVYFDAYTGGRYDVYSVECDGVKVGEPVRLSSGVTWCSTPVAGPDGHGDAVVAWQGIGTDKYVCYDVAVDGRTERVGSCQSTNTSQAVCANAEAAWVTWRVHGSMFLMRRLDRASGRWSAPLVMPRTGRYCRRPSTAVDGKGTLWVAWQSPPLNRGRSKRPPAKVSGQVWTPPARLASVGEAHRRSRIFLQRIRPEQMAALANPAVSPHEWPSEAGHEIAAQAPGLVRPEEGAQRVYFGDLHGHANVSDGLGTHDQFYRSARDVSGLDFASVVEHAEFPEELTNSEWNMIRLVARQFDEPGRFVTLLGYEWTSNEVGRPHGHKNVYYPHDAGGLFSAMRPGGETPEALFAHVGQCGGLVMPHHVSVAWSPTDWESHDPSVQRVCEIASIHGVMEYDGHPRGHGDPPVPGCSVQAALARGCRLGLIAGSDTHRLAPGRNGGIAAVISDGLSREEVFAALRSRRCYASTGPRVLIEFSVAGHGMGEEVALGELGESLPVGYRVEADRPIESIEVVRNNETVHRHEPGDSNSAGEWQDPGRPTPGTYYYLRITLAGGEFAWSSPVWFG